MGNNAIIEIKKRRKVGLGKDEKQRKKENMTEGLIGMEGGGTKLQTGKGNKGNRDSTFQGKK